jgi:hypothetical protein
VATTTFTAGYSNTPPTGAEGGAGRCLPPRTASPQTFAS